MCKKQLVHVLAYLLSVISVNKQIDYYQEVAATPLPGTQI